MPNAVQISIETDGTVKFGADLNEFLNLDNAFEPKPVRSLRLRIVGARARLPAFVEIGAYPVDGAAISLGRDNFQNPYFSNGAYGQPEPRVDVELRFAVPIMVRRFFPQPNSGISFGNYLNPREAEVEPSTDQRSILITIITDRADTLGASRLNRSPEKNRHHKLEIKAVGNNRFEVNVLHTPLNQVADAFTRASGNLFLANENAAKLEISLFLPAATPRETLNALETGYGLISRQIEGGATVIGRGGEFEQSRRLPLQNLEPNEARLLFPDFLLPALRVDRAGNALIATAAPRVLDRLASDLKKLDLPRAQFRVEAKIYELAASRDYEFALRLTRSIGRDSQTLNTQTGEFTVRLAPDQVAQLNTTLQALSDRGRARLLAAPFTTVLGGESGSLFLGQNRYIKVLRPRGGVLSPEALALQIGYGLEVTPRGSMTGPITLEIAPRVSTVVDIENETGLPSLALREISAVSRLEAGDAILIAGLDSDLEFQTRKTGPIPFFRGARRENEARNRLIVVVSVARV